MSLYFLWFNYSERLSRFNREMILFSPVNVAQKCSNFCSVPWPKPSVLGRSFTFSIWSDCCQEINVKGLPCYGGHPFILHPRANVIWRVWWRSSGFQNQTSLFFPPFQPTEGGRQRQKVVCGDLGLGSDQQKWLHGLLVLRDFRAAEVWSWWMVRMQLV